MVDRKVLARIRKLMALAGSPNASEAASAIAHAQRLMAEHGIDADDLELAGIEQHAVREGGGRTPPIYLMALVMLVRHVFGVESVRSSATDEVIFFGQAARAELAAYSFTVLSRQLMRARRAYLAGLTKRLKRTTRIARADAFCEGWAEAAYSHVQRLVPSQREQQLLLAYKERTWGGHLVQSQARSAKPTRGGDAWFDGRAAGRDIRLDRPMPGGRSPTMIGAS